MLAVYLVSQVAILFITRDLGTDFLGIQVTLSAERFADIAGSWQSSGLLDAYYRHFYLDYVHPFIYSFFLSCLMALAFNKRNTAGKYNAFLILPFMAGALDIAENTFHLYMLSDFNRITEWMVMLSGTCTNLKWFISSGCLLAAVIMFMKSGKRTVPDI